jgi:general stress protein 26
MGSTLTRRSIDHSVAKDQRLGMSSGRGGRNRSRPERFFNRTPRRRGDPRQETFMAESSDADRVYELINDVSVCMLTSKAGPSLRARPMHAKVDRATGTITFLTDARHHKDDEIAADPEVCLAFAKPGSEVYVSISGRAKVTDDRAAIEARFNEMAKVWFPGGPQDPNVRLLTVHPHAAEYWDGKTNPITVAFELVKARLSSERPDLGENRKVALGGGR